MRPLQRVLSVLLALSGLGLMLGLVDGKGDLALFCGLVFVIVLASLWWEELRHRRQ